MRMRLLSRSSASRAVVLGMLTLSTSARLPTVFAAEVAGAPAGGPVAELKLGEGKPPEPADEAAPAQPPANAPAADLLPARIGFRDYLVIPPVGQYGRAALHTDAVEAQLVDGTWKPPHAGDSLAVGTDKTVTWEPGEIDSDGYLEREALRGGYAYAAIESPASGIMLLQAQGHGVVFVNGVPRAGDPYHTGWMHIPVELKAGANHFLFHVATGRLTAELVKPAATLTLQAADATLPHLVTGQAGPYWGAVVLVNAGNAPLSQLAMIATRPGAEPTRTELRSIPACSAHKIPFRMDGAVPAEPGKQELQLQVVRREGDHDQPLAAAMVTLEIRKADQPHVRTLVSAVDGSVQPYAVRIAAPTADGGPAALLLTLHGAGVTALEQVGNYAPQPGLHVVAPTNRRPQGFDWEDWGRIDAVEVFAEVLKQLPIDPRRVYLTGHAMGGHGAWHLGATYPDRFAAVGPSAGWFSFWSYGGMPKYEDPSPIEEILMRAVSPSDTLKLKRNLLPVGVYVLHGDADEVVPVSQSRFMRQQLATFHSNFSYFEQPQGRHWSGPSSCDWPAMIDFFRRQSSLPAGEKQTVDFSTASPGVSASSYWLAIEQQQEQFELSQATITYDPALRSFSGTTTNVTRLAIDVSHVPANKPLEIELDGQKLDSVRWPSARRLWFSRDEDDRWVLDRKPSLEEKGPHRYGSFKDVFSHNAVLVYGTQGNPEENAWSYAKARFDAETFWYRGNGSFEVVADKQFEAGKNRNRNVVLYGNADTNAAWPALLSTSPVQIRRDSIRVGQRPETGDDLGCLMIRPRPGSNSASVGVVGGTGLPGLRATNRLRYFISGVAYPDLFIYSGKSLSEGNQQIRMLGYFGLDWGLDNGQFEWRDLAL